MEVQNSLPLLLDCLNRWKTVPTERQFIQEYAEPMQSLVGDFFDDYHSVLQDLSDANEWTSFRAEAMKLDESAELARARKNIGDVEQLFGFKLGGKLTLMGAFGAMDGFARFDCGDHHVFLGVDEGHLQGRYLDVLTVHELTHVARESRPSVWEGFGLDPRMTRPEFVENLPVIEHLFGEGFSCLISEILVPGETPWTYGYVTEEGFNRIRSNSASADIGIRRELKSGNPDYGRLYSPGHYHPQLPTFAHYVWGWKWTERLLRDLNQSDVRKLVNRSSQEFFEDALQFELRL